MVDEAIECPHCQCFEYQDIEGISLDKTYSHKCVECGNSFSWQTEIALDMIWVATWAGDLIKKNISRL